MAYEEQKQKLASVIKESLVAACNTHMADFSSSFEVDGVIGITLDRRDVVLVKINECFATLPSFSGRSKPKKRKPWKPVERAEEVIQEVTIPMAATDPDTITQEVVQELPITVKQEMIAVEDGEVLLEGAHVIVQDGKEISSGGQAAQSVFVLPQSSSSKQKDISKLGKQERQKFLCRMRATKYNQYLKELRKKLVLTAEEHAILQKERRKSRERGRLFRERQKLRKRIDAAHVPSSS